MAHGEVLRTAAFAFAEGVLAVFAAKWEKLRPESFPTHGERRSTGKSFVAGWRVTLDVDGYPETLLLMVDSNYPFSWPIIFLPNNDLFLKWPHVERDGRLCLIEKDVHRMSGPQVIGPLLESAGDLIRNNRKGLLNDDFAREFLSYWEQSCSADVRQLFSLVLPSPPSRLIHGWIGVTHTIVAETVGDVERWHEHRFGSKLKKSIEIPLIWLDQPLYPKDFPHSNADIYNLIKSAFGDDFAERRWLTGLQTVADTGAPVLIGVTAPDGPVLVGVWTTPSSGAKNGVLKGFRSKRPYRADALLLRLLFPGLPARRAPVERCDGEWIHSRGGTVEQTALFKRTVVLIGCGSLGSSVAQMLAQTGVGRVILVDPEGLTFDNIARHELGANNVGKNKAAALALSLLARFPHLTIEGHACNWETLHKRSPTLLQSADVVVSLTADWLSEVALNTLARSTDSFPPVVFGWAENHASAGHALAVMASGGCLECGLDTAGNFIAPVVTWTAATVMKEPACGAYYQPYGAVDMAPVCTLIAETVLDVLYGRMIHSELRTWIGRVERIRSLGGEVSTQFRDRHGDPGDGTRFLRAGWTIHSGCGQCR